jgi:hypothetical protein
VAPQEQPQARLCLDGVLIWTRDVDQLQNIVRLLEEDRPGTEELSQAVRSAPSEAVGKTGLEVVGEYVFEHLLRRDVAFNKSNYRSIVSITIGSRVADSVNSITFRRQYSVEVPCPAGEDVGALLDGEILHAGEHQFVDLKSPANRSTGRLLPTMQRCGPKSSRSSLTTSRTARSERRLPRQQNADSLIQACGS